MNEYGDENSDEDEVSNETIEFIEESEPSNVDIPKSVLWYLEPTDIAGMVRIKLKRLTQKIIGCEVGENVTTEYPWIFVRKEIIEDNLDLHSESSDFLPVRDEILEYPEHNVLIGYAPLLTDDEGHFNICLTENSRDVVMTQIENLRSEQENRVKNSVFKTVGIWQDLGSGIQVDQTLVKNTRELFEIEVKIKSEFLDSSENLLNRNADDQRDGHVELVPSRQSFNNVTRRLVSRGDQANPATSDNEAQTTTWTSINSWFQYFYDYKPINTSAYNEDEAHAIEKFLRYRTNVICDKSQLNATWDLHVNDYENLVKNKKDTIIPVPVVYSEYQRYHDGKLSKKKIIYDLCWHPHESGIAIATYTQHARGENLRGRSRQDKVLRACQGDNKVLVWSFNDCLTPKLILQCPREVTAVSIRPLDGNVIIGGCSNGQIAVWLIPEKIDEIEAMAMSTAAQVKYRVIMTNLMSWMKETTNSKTIHPTVMSSIENSQKGPITQIIWLASHNKLDENGRIVELEANSKAEELGWQFVTSSKDGTVAFWDLRAGEKIKLPHVPKRKWKKTKRIVPKPEALARSISPFKALDGVFSPTYMLTVKHPNEERRVVITAMSFYVPKLRRVQVEPFPTDEEDIGTRRYYKSVIEKPEHETPRMILVGTLEGDVGRVTWDGYEFTTGLKMNRDTVRWIWKNEGIHDGPVIQSLRSNYLNDVILTIGGKAFAIWREDFDEPVFLRRSITRYTACCWDTNRPTVFMLARDDGILEIWDLIVKSNEACITQSISGKIISGIYTHELYLKSQCVAFCDFNGTMRVFAAPMDFLVVNKNDDKWMRTFVDREIDRMKQLRSWRKYYKETNIIKSTAKNKPKEEKQDKEIERKLDKVHNSNTEMLEILKKNEFSEIKFKAGQFIEEAKIRWKTMELKRMQRVILEKKGLRAEDLEKRREPVLKLRQEARKKKERIHDMMQQRDRIFEDTVAFLFPERNYEHEQTSVTTRRTAWIATSSDNKEDEKIKADILIYPMKNESNTCSPQQDIIHEFEQVVTETLTKMKQRPYSFDTFNWRKILDDGQTRRYSIDVDLKKVPKKYGSLMKTDENPLSFI